MATRPGKRTDREDDGLRGEDDCAGQRVDAGDQQRDDQHCGGDPGREARSPDVDLTGSVGVRHDAAPELLYCTTIVAARATGILAAPSAALKGALLAATTTAAARDAAQINCAATGEHELYAGGHVMQLTQWHCHQANSGASADRRSSALGTPAVR